jgi:cytochrome P450
MKVLNFDTSFQALKALLRDRSLLGPLEVLYARTGRPFRIPLPSFQPLVIGGPEANRRLLVSEQHKVRWRNADPVTDLLRRGVLVTDGEEHDRYRGLMESSLHLGALRSYVQMMVRQTDRVTVTWQDGQVVNMLDECRRIALLIIMDALFSVDAWNDIRHIWTPVLKAIEYIRPGAWIFWRRIPRPGFRKHLARLDDYLYEIIRSRRAASKEDMLQHLIDAGLDDDRIRDQMLTMLIAGHDTSTALVAWTFYLLGTNPEVGERLIRELDEAIGENAPASPSGWQPQLLDQVIKESLRMYPPIHIGNRVVAAEMEFEGQRVRAGERLFYSIYLTHRDGRHWQNPDSFQPERFAGGRKAPPFAYVPFGGGPRSCIGAAFGMAEARLVLARLLQTHHFELTKANVRAKMGATLEPAPGVFMRVEKRKK